MWPRLVANKILRKTLGSNNSVADFPSCNTNETFQEYFPASKNDIQEYLSPIMTLPFKHYKDTHGYKVFVSTWNVGGFAPTKDIDMKDRLDTYGTDCDIYVLGFQEIVPLRASNVLGSENNKTLSKWNSLIREVLNKKLHQDFKYIISKQMVGIMISVWVRSHLRPFIRDPSVSCVGCGIMGCLGNKGSVSVRFQLHETSFCFVCSHLASGGREGDEKHRNTDVVDIFRRTKFPRGSLLNLPRKILDHDRVILLGDLNYRISLPEPTTRLLVEGEEWNVLLENDQLSMELNDGNLFQGWREGSIRFPPTYKYCPNSDLYFGCIQAGKRGEKKRAPAWCDRIIWYGNGIKQHLYTRGESKLSDHRPVKAIFTADVSIIRDLKAYQSLFLSDRLDRSQATSNYHQMIIASY
ncbi:type IV inositol polyphosphate 5-phosphatase 9 [Rutidosis leptorrhynchoides]|uniref:type IV inositol polyphosphate 5-phosphatase 9 n=1 Tax=Rutidosis leptorrhynchoides TaxID=125765 RepID=UPI003A99C68B